MEIQLTQHSTERRWSCPVFCNTAVCICSLCFRFTHLKNYHYGINFSAFSQASIVSSRLAWSISHFFPLFFPLQYQYLWILTFNCFYKQCIYISEFEFYESNIILWLLSTEYKLLEFENKYYEMELHLLHYSKHFFSSCLNWGW